MFDEVNFEIEKEGWNIYELVDGKHRVTMRMRVILTTILKPKIVHLEEPPMMGVPKEAQPERKASKEDFQLTFQNIVVVADCPAELMGKPTPPVPPSEFSQLATEDVEFIPLNEDWNVYTIPDSGVKMKVKLVVSSVGKANGHYDQLGYPFYIVQSTNAIVPVLPKKK